jgi:hypothetical protein
MISTRIHLLKSDTLRTLEVSMVKSKVAQTKKPSKDERKAGGILLNRQAIPNESKRALLVGEPTDLSQLKPPTLRPSFDPRETLQWLQCQRLRPNLNSSIQYLEFQDRMPPYDPNLQPVCRRRNQNKVGIAASYKTNVVGSGTAVTR